MSGGGSQRSFTLSCPEIKASIGGTLWISPAQGAPRGMVVGFSGGTGILKWVENFSIDTTWLNNVTSAGYEVVQVQWAQPGWEAASSGELAGAAHAACRPATAINWIYSNLYLQLSVPRPARGACGFCIAGTSAGGSVVAYVLAYYGLDSIVNAAIPISGPPHAAITKGCLDSAGYAYDQLANALGALALLDSSWGYYNGTGPCTNHQSSFASHWDPESADLGGNDYYYPNTRIHVILGGYDSPVIIHHAQDYIARLTATGSPMVSQETVPGMPHDIMGSASGLAQLLAAIEAGGSGGGSSSLAPTGATPSSSPSASPSASPTALGSPSPKRSAPTGGSGGGSPSASANPSAIANLARSNSPFAIVLILVGVALVILVGAVAVTRGALLRSAVRATRTRLGRRKPPGTP
ncbi:MAG TPA: hypothetical protein VJR46_10945 [Candidatus Dormibacteraeota bacterium]|nr:hypothetical protein [Candidatus Dormibacteraeota bacterium]